MKDNTNGNCHYCGAKLERVYFASGGHKFCPNTDCLSKFQDGVQPQPLHTRNKLSWKFQETRSG